MGPFLSQTQKQTPDDVMMKIMYLTYKINKFSLTAWNWLVTNSGYCLSFLSSSLKLTVFALILAFSVILTFMVI